MTERSYPHSTGGGGGGGGGGAVSSVNGRAGAVSGLAEASQLAASFEQVAPSASWTVTHNLGYRPSVTVIDSAGSVVLGDVTHLSVNQVRIDFSAAFAGTAHFS